MPVRIVTAALMTAFVVSPLTSQTLPQFKVREALRIGSIDQENYALTAVTSIAASPNGLVYVAQPQDGRIHVYDARGRFVRKIGRKGAGPGEFRSIDRMTITKRGLYILDMANRRTTLVNAQGNVIQSWPQVQHFWGPMFASTPPLAGFDDGTMVTRPTYLLSDAKEVAQVPVGMTDSRGKYLRDLQQLSVRGKSVRVNDGVHMMNVDIPNNTSTLFEVMPSDTAIVAVDRTVDGTKSTFTITKTHTSGRRVFAQRFSVPSVPITRADITQQVKSQAANLVKHRGTLISPAQANQMFDMAYGDLTVQSPVDHISTGSDGTFWLRRGSFGASRADWVVFDSSGKMRGQVQLPIDVQILFVTRTTAWATLTDEDDVSYVVRYELGT